MGVSDSVSFLTKTQTKELSFQTIYSLAARFLHLFFPDLVCETAYELFYSKIGQHTSVGNYWNDPHHQVSSKFDLLLHINIFVNYISLEFFRNCITNIVISFHT